MEKLVIHGGTRLVGQVQISGAKNAAVAIIPAALLIDGECIIDNLPNISDVKLYCEILKSLGAKVEFLTPNCVKIDSSNITSTIAPSEITRKFRASYYVLGALLSRFKSAQVSFPGGCDLGTRPIDQHIKGFETLGAQVEINGGNIKVFADKLTGDSIYMDIVSVGATMNIMLAAVLAEGVTTIENAAKEPHIVDLANFLNTMGANIKGAGTDTIKITGVEKLTGGKMYSVVPDQIEAGTFLMAAVATKGDITIKNCITAHLASITAKLEEMGVEITDNIDEMRIRYVGDTSAVNIKTLPYPGFPTDMQPQTAVALCLCKGRSIINESIWSSRFQYAFELNKMGANISIQDKMAIIEGVDELKGAPVYATDLRAGAALIIAGCSAKGTTEIFNIEHIDRGYENIEEKFKALGANIERVEYEEK
ncbi:MAG: UDP-N-acetylglucosamine 1-carboxyvinyltransferase [Clostridiales bacterium]|nr:UDP-N-acetylglucosamine 1-carboxyvinyltransferase [Clostridiales bacterium]